MANSVSRTGLQTGFVFDIKRFALHDGPGIRTTVFLKGCPLACSWCHNPESQSKIPELLFQSDRCTGCGACVDACPSHATKLEQGQARIDRTRCSGCGGCVAACQSSARSLCGSSASVNEIVARVERDTLFHDESNGGVTLSGGEPLMQPAFCAALLEAFRARRIHTTVDTCGYADWSWLDSIAEHTDLFLFDLKAADDRRHLDATGVSNRVILENLRQLDARGSRLWIRVPLIPDFNDDPAELERIAGLIATIAHAEAVQVLPYHTAGVGKEERIGRRQPIAPLHKLPLEQVERAVELLQAGLQVPVTMGG